MNRKIIKYVYISVIFLFALLFVAKFGGPALLKSYIEMGIGGCQKIPIFCMAPEEVIINPAINREYLAELIPYNFPQVSIYIPKHFKVVNETIKKVYYKKNKRKQTGDVIYVLYKQPNFFVNLFPQLKKRGIDDDYEFIKRTMYAKIKDINNPTDAFFVIMKGIFIPDVGQQNALKMVKFNMPGKRGFINYNLTKTDNYFDCNIISNEGGFFKIYIKDKGATLNLDKALAIISTINKNKLIPLPR